MRISDWSSDVCSSDLVEERAISRCGMQLEAYCTGIGKALLANLPPADQEDYLASGSFVPLTKTTLVTAEALKGEFDHIVARSEERRVGNESVSTCRSRLYAYH